MFTKMVNMARTAEAVKEAIDKSPAAAFPPNEPEFPWGLSLSFDEEVMDKLGIDEMPGVGDMCHMMAMAKVTSVSENEMMVNGKPKKCRRIEMQITDLGVENENEEGDEAKPARSSRGNRYKAKEAEVEEEE